MKKYRFLYPAIFIKDEEGHYQVVFPDLDIYIDGDNLSQAYLYAKDLLRVYFTYALKYETDYAKPTQLEKIISKCKGNEVVMYVDAYIDEKEIQ